MFVAKFPKDYPYSPPIIRFSTKIVLTCVDAKGYVNVSRIPNYKWNPHHNLADVLMAVREAMKDKASIDASYKVINQEFFEQQASADKVELNFS